MRAHNWAGRQWRCGHRNEAAGIRPELECRVIRAVQPAEDVRLVPDDQGVSAEDVVVPLPVTNLGDNASSVSRTENIPVGLNRLLIRFEYQAIRIENVHLLPSTLQ